MGVASGLGSSLGVVEGSEKVRQEVSALIRPRPEKCESREVVFKSSFINIYRQASSQIAN